MAEDGVENRDLERSFINPFTLRILMDRCVSSMGEMGVFLPVCQEKRFIDPSIVKDHQVLEEKL